MGRPRTTFAPIRAPCSAPPIVPYAGRCSYGPDGSTGKASRTPGTSSRAASASKYNSDDSDDEDDDILGGDDDGEDDADELEEALREEEAAQKPTRVSSGRARKAVKYKVSSASAASPLLCLLTAAPSALLPSPACVCILPALPLSVCGLSLPFCCPLCSPISPPLCLPSSLSAPALSLLSCLLLLLLCSLPPISPVLIILL